MHLYGKYGIGDNVRDEYMEFLKVLVPTISTVNREQLDLLDILSDELGLSLQERKPCDYFLDQLIGLLEISNDKIQEGDFLIDLGFTIERSNRVKGINKDGTKFNNKKTIIVDGE